jgi:hypothetical protein
VDGGPAIRGHALAAVTRLLCLPDGMASRLRGVVQGEVARREAAHVPASPGSSKKRGRGADAPALLDPTQGSCGNAPHFTTRTACPRGLWPTPRLLRWGGMRAGVYSRSSARLFATPCLTSVLFFLATGPSDPAALERVRRQDVGQALTQGLGVAVVERALYAGRLHTHRASPPLTRIAPPCHHPHASRCRHPVPASNVRPKPGG